ncbi:MAG: bifunctional methylenetetrahydrofolate dehydrogenase/methenyltetrahydrofolate cyclohydrolase FolD [Gammaproteobacteria bacterium]
MSAQILDGKRLAEKMIAQCKQTCPGFKPGLAVILVGNDLASRIYVGNKKKMAEKAGIHSLIIELPENAEQEEVLKKVQECNDDPAIHGFIVQLPLPAHLNETKILEAIDPAKDVDGFHAYNLGRLFQSKDYEMLPPATPAGIIQLLEEYGIEVEGKEVVVVGRSNIVGKPVSVMLLNRNATVTVCHSRTKNLAYHTSRADILIVSVGKAGTITEEMVRDGAVVIDVGINRSEDGRLVGDVDFESVSKKAGYITPVPGGVGPMTIASLIANTVRAALSRVAQGADSGDMEFPVRERIG